MVNWLLCLLYWDDVQNLNPTYIIYAIITILVSLVIHEVMHGVAAFKLGDTTASDGGRLTLNPLAHIDPLMTIALPIGTLILFGAPILAAKPVPFNPDRLKFDEFGAAIVAFAGPLSNLVLAILGGLILNHVTVGISIAEFLNVFVTLNVAIFVFNMVPIPPLDGSRVLYAFAPEGVQDVMRQIEPYGFFIVIALVVAGAGGYLSEINQMIINVLP